MPDIKVKDVAKGTVKAIDKSATAAQRMKTPISVPRKKRNTAPRRRRVRPKNTRLAAFPVVWIQHRKLCVNLTGKAAKV